MAKLQIYEYKGTQIEFEIIDGQVFANATGMCQAFGRRPINWLDLSSTKRYIEALMSKSGNLTSVVETRKGGNLSNQGTWIHEKLILKLAQWLDADFEIWCDEKMAELIRTGTVTIKPLSSAEMFLHNAQLMVEHEKRIEAIENKQTQTDDRILQIESKVNTRPNYLTVVGFAVLNGKSLTMKKAKELGKIASLKCREKNLDIEKVQDTRFGLINSYPMEVLKEVFSEAA